MLRTRRQQQEPQLEDQPEEQPEERLERQQPQRQRQTEHNDVTVTNSGNQQRTACFSCRTARQRCDRRMPCSRCVLQHQPCRYPFGSNRGRKQGSTNKPDTVEKLLSRINESSVREQVIAAIIESHVSHQNAPVRSLDSPASLHASSCPGVTTNTSAEHASSANGPSQTNQVATEIDLQSTLVSPLHILAAAVASDGSPIHQRHDPDMMPSFQNPAIRNQTVCPIDDRLMKYFAPQATYDSDWHILASQSIDSTLKLEPTTCDPITARLIDQNDASLYFKLFFKIRNPLVGLLDPILHTPEYVFSTSFTLFSVICALGCAISTQPRDRILYPALLSLAEGGMKWSIAASVKSLETIQAIINMQYWAPVCQKQSDDTYWLHISHAAQLARELGIHKPNSIAEYVNAISSRSNADFKGRLFRNFERTWLYIFIADKSFGITTGRSTCISWKELPTSVPDWWRNPMASPHDRIISGIVEMRGFLLHALEQRKNADKTPASVLHWHSHAFAAFNRLRTARCTADDLPSAVMLPVLAFYIDHSVLVLNAQASRDLMTIDSATTSTELLTITKKTVDVASRLLGLFLFDQVLQELMLGFHNNQFIMICHAVTEILHAIARGGLMAVDINEAASRVREAPNHMERIARGLPTTSAAHLYVQLSRFFACQLEKIAVHGNTQDERGGIDPSFSFADWLREVDGHSLDSAAWIDMGFLSSEQPIFSTINLNVAQEPTGGDFILP
ncbi:hypothetical protein GGI43DRAFT_409238 [Trichoderma evansii]